MRALLQRLPRSVRAGAAVLLLLLVLALLAWAVALPLAFEPLLRWGLAQATSSWAGHRLDFQAARWSPWRLAADVDGLALRGPQGDELASLRALHVDLATAGLLQRAWRLEALRIDAPRLTLALGPAGVSNWDALLQALRPTSAAPVAASGPPRLQIDDLRITAGRLAFADRRSGAERTTVVEPIDLQLNDLSTLPEHRGTHLLAARSTLGGTLRWEGRFELTPLQAEGRIEIEGLQLARLWALLPEPPLRIAAPAGQARVALGYRVDDRSWRLDGVRVQLDGLGLQGIGAASPALQLDQIVLDGGRVDGARREAAFTTLQLAGGRVQARRDAQGRIDLAAWAPTEAAAPQPSPSPTPPAAAPAAWTLRLERLAAERIALAYEDLALAEPLRVETAAAALQLGVDATLGGPVPALAVRDLSLQLDALALRSGDAPPWLALQQLRLEGGTLDLATRRIDAARLQLRDGRLALQRTRDGALMPLQGLAPRASGAAAAAATKEATPAADPDWQLRLASLQLEGWNATFTDASVTPAASFALDGVGAELRGLGNDLRQPVQVQAAAVVRSGGRLAAQGRVTPAATRGSQGDLRIRVDALALSSAQPYLDPWTTLRLTGGAARTDGRLQWRGAQVSYAGGAGLDGLRVDAPGRDQPFLTLSRLDAPRLRLAPERLDLGALTVEGLAAELTIDRERRLDAAQFLRAAPPAQQAPPGAQAAPSSGASPSTPAPPVVIERVRVVDARLDFADLSLALPFAARIERLNGEVAGLDSSAGAPPASLELEGQVAPNGLARARGRLQPLAPTAFSDVQVSFRNIEMTTLTPYTATFAGRRIASGKLSLDLDYKLRERRMQGDNRVVMERLQLGERVESASATSLPLDLAIALLEDSDGRIDLGLPVSGSIDDPQFSVGALVWKAIVNVLTKIVTAPFRAIGALFGGNDALADGIGRILFDPGRSTLLPPEREKLQKLAQALAKRPALAVLLPQASVEADRAALRELQLRRTLASIEGRAPGPGGEPGPLALQLPGTQAALERRFAERFGADALAQVRARFAPPPGGTAPKPASTPPAAAPVAPPAADGRTGAEAADSLHALLWQRLLAAEVVDDAALAALGGARRESMAAGLREAGLEPARVRDGTAAAAEATDAGVVVRLDLGPAGASR